MSTGFRARPPVTAMQPHHVRDKDTGWRLVPIRFNNKLWKSISTTIMPATCRVTVTCGGCLLVGDGFPELDQTIWCGFGILERSHTSMAMRPRILQRVKYGSPSGLMQIMR